MDANCSATPPRQCLTVNRTARNVTGPTFRNGTALVIKVIPVHCPATPSLAPISTSVAVEVWWQINPAVAVPVAVTVTTVVISHTARIDITLRSTHPQPVVPAVMLPPPHRPTSRRLPNASPTRLAGGTELSVIPASGMTNYPIGPQYMSFYQCTLHLGLCRRDGLYRRDS